MLTASVIPPDKTAIAASFSQAAQSYDQSAALQRHIGEQLLGRLPDGIDVQQWLDLGCGTGYFSAQLATRFPSASGIGLDIAEGMLTQAQQRLKLDAWLVADAEQLPLQNHSLDLMFSNLAVQWCHDFTKVLSEAYRVLKPQGVFLFTSLCQGTLEELKYSWQQVDEYQHVNHFLPFSHYQQMVAESAFTFHCVEAVPEVCYYSELTAMMQDLKGIGAHNINPKRNKGLTSRQQLKKLIHGYELFRDEQGLPATYQVVYGCLVKEL